MLWNGQSRDVPWERAGPAPMPAAAVMALRIRTDSVLPAHPEDGTTPPDGHPPDSGSWEPGTSQRRVIPDGLRSTVRHPRPLEPLVLLPPSQRALQGPFTAFQKKPELSR
jgi:hypothetical protein